MSTGQSVKQQRDDFNKLVRDAAKRIWDSLFAAVKWWPLFRRTDYTKDPLYLKSEEFKKVFDPGEENHARYTWVLTHAKDAYEALHKTFNDLDAKADTIIKYLGVGTPVATLAVLINITPETAYLVYWLMPAALCAVGSIFFAMWALEPTSVPTAPHVNTAAEYVDFFEDRSEVAFLGLWHCCCEGMSVKVTEKAHFVRVAGWLLVGTLVSLLLPMAVWPAYRANMTPAQPKPVLVQVVPASSK